MAHTYCSAIFHIVFSTKERRKTITIDFRERLWAYLGGIAKQNDMKSLAIGGTDDHVHMLLSLPTTLSISKTVQLLKGGSSKWVHDTFPSHADFAWQEAYAAFSVSRSATEDVSEYIRAQEERHRTRTFEDEFVAFLQKHDLAYDPRYVFG